MGVDPLLGLALQSHWGHGDTRHPVSPGWSQLMVRPFHGEPRFSSENIRKLERVSIAHRGQKEKKMHKENENMRYRIAENILQKTHLIKE